MIKIKLTREELIEAVKKSVKNILKEDWYHEDYTDRGSEDYNNRSSYPEDSEFDSDVDNGETRVDEDLIEFDIPSWAISALINGDESGLEDEDVAKLNKFVNSVVNRFGNANFMMNDIDGEDSLGFRPSNDIDSLYDDVYKLYIKPSEMNESIGLSEGFYEEGPDSENDNYSDANQYLDSKENEINMSDGDDLDEVLNSYLETLIWSSGEEFDEFLNRFRSKEGYGVFDFSAPAKAQNDIKRFVKLIEKTPGAIEQMNKYDEKSFGHYFALSRNGHGSGFFDDKNDILQDLARNFGQADLYVGDDGKLDMSGSVFNESKNNKNMTSIKLSRQELSEMVKRSVQKVLTEDWDGGAAEDFENSNGITLPEDEQSEEFVPHGSYTVSNSGGYLVMLSDDGEMAKVRESFGSENPETSGWLPIEYVNTEELDDEGYPETEPIIDPEGYNIPLNQVMRINQFRESKKPNTVKVKLSELREIIKTVVKEHDSK